MDARITAVPGRTLIALLALAGTLFAVTAAQSTSLPAQSPSHEYLSPIPRRQGLSLLQCGDHLTRAIPSSQFQGWKSELHHPGLAPARSALLHVWVGEVELAQNEQPALALYHFRTAQQLTRTKSPVSGLARFDEALAEYASGAYGQAWKQLSALGSWRKAYPGYDWRSAAVLARHAGACFAYHQERARMGIPEPPQTDPRCGAAALASALRSLSLPWSKTAVLASCRVTGQGSTLQDLINAGRKLGVVVRPVTANDAGLIALPKPLIAHVERDHFISVISANRRGVSYLCSDCGAWPGGQVDLTWDQWHALSPDIYGCVTRAGTTSDQWIAAVLSGKRHPVQLASAGSLKGLIPTLNALAVIKPPWWTAPGSSAI